MLLSKNYYKKLTVLSIIAGVIYNSWPIGHWLNPIVSKLSLASGLEAVGQPYNWLFIGSDIVSSILIIILCMILWKGFRKHQPDGSIYLAVVCIGLFGLGTIVDALLPERCVQGVMTCPSFTHDHLLLYHGIFSIIASAFLFISLCILWFHKRKNVLLNILLVGYIIFGLISLIQAIAPGKDGNWSQDYYISLCSVWLAAVPYAVSMTHKTDILEFGGTK